MQNKQSECCHTGPGELRRDVGMPVSASSGCQWSPSRATEVKQDSESSLAWTAQLSGGI